MKKIIFVAAWFLSAAVLDAQSPSSGIWWVADGKTASQEEAREQVPAGGTSEACAAERVDVPPAAALPAEPGAFSYFKPKSTRDPTISPVEYGRIQEAKERLAAQERGRRKKMMRDAVAERVENRLRLQGIVGDVVIINGESYRAGQRILGVKIVKVGDDYFIGDDKGRRFKKALK